LLFWQRTQLIHRRRSNRNARAVRRSSWLGWGLWGLAALFSVLVLMTMIGLGAGYAVLRASLPPVETLAVMLHPKDGTLLQPTRIYDRSGSHLLAALENPGITRRMLPLDATQPDALSPALAQTVVLALQPDFWQNPGFNWQTITANLPETIAERLVRKFLLPGADESRLDTLRVRLTANQLLARYGHAQILEWFLNSTSFGHLTFGAETAAQLYLSKSASQLNFLDAALLTAAMEAPALNPIDAPAAAHDNQMKILARMVIGGLISEEDLRSARGLSILTPRKPAGSVATRAFTALVINRLAPDSNRRALLEQGGLTILTTLDFDLQLQLECVVRVQLSRQMNPQNPVTTDNCDAAQFLPPLPSTAESAIPAASLAASGVLLDPLTGQVLALTGDTTVAAGEESLHSHPSGSVQTPLLALTAFARSLSPATLVWDLPPDGNEPAADTLGTFHGPVRLRTALEKDYLPALTTVLDQVGPEAVTQTARSLGLNGYTIPGDNAATLTDGPALDPLELAHAFSIFSTSGNQSGIAVGGSQPLQPQFILSIQDAAAQGIFTVEKSQTSPLISPQLAYLVHQVFSDPESQDNPLTLNRPAAIKTGLADLGRSTWAAGYTRSAAGVIWLGYARSGVPAAPLEVKAAAGIWQALMEYASQGQPVLDWTMPEGVTLLDVCDPSGLLPTANCPNVVTEVFLADNLPTARDSLYQKFQIDRETGRLATIFTPPELVTEQTFLVVPPEARRWSQLASLPLPPVEYDNIQSVPVNANAVITAPGQFSFIQGTLRLLGTANGAGFLSYRLDVGRGINPTAWINILDHQTTPVADGKLGEWDTTGLDGLYIVRLMVIHEGQQVDLAYLQLTVDNTPPEVSIPYPLPGQVFTGVDQRTITLQTQVQDTVGIARVEWWMDGNRLGVKKTQPYAFIWDGTPGTHRLQVRAVDLAGNEARSLETEFTVR